MIEKFDFSKIEDQKKFDSLPSNTREQIIDSSHEEALDIKRILDEGKEIRRNNGKILIEIGCGSEPFFIKSQREIQKNEQYVGIDYVHDQAEFNKERLQKNINNHRDLVNGKIGFLEVSGEKSPLEDESVDEVVFRDVFGDPTWDFVKKDEFDPNNPEHVCIGKSYVIEDMPRFDPEFICEEKNRNYLNDEFKNKQFLDMDDSEKELVVAFYIKYFDDKNKTLLQNSKRKLLDEAFRILKENGKIEIIEVRTPEVADEFFDEINLSKDTRFEQSESNYKISDFKYSGCSKNSKILTLRKLKINQGLIFDQEKEIINAVMHKVQDINKNETAYSTIGIYQLAQKEKSLVDLIEGGTLGDVLKDGLLGNRGGPGDYVYQHEDVKDSEGLITRQKWAENARQLHKGVVHFNIVGRGSDVNKKRNKIASSEWSFKNKMIILFDLEAFKEEEPLAFRKTEEKYDLNQKSRTYLAADPDPKKLIKKGKKMIPKTDFGYMLAHRVAPKFFRGIIINFSSTEGEHYVDSPKYDKISKTYSGRSVEKKEIVGHAVSIMKEIYGDKNSLYLPIYDLDGNLLWPKEMSYKEIKESVEK